MAIQAGNARNLDVGRSAFGCCCILKHRALAVSRLGRNYWTRICECKPPRSSGVLPGLGHVLPDRDFAGLMRTQQHAQIIFVHFDLNDLLLLVVEVCEPDLSSPKLI